MKSKGVKILLLAIVAGLWGYIGYMVYSYSKSDEPSLSQNSSQPNEVQKDTTSYHYALDYTDPFLGSNSLKPTKKNKGKTTSSKKQIDWPEINYVGHIKGKTSIAMISYKGSTQLVKMGDKIEGFYVRTITPNVVLLELNGARKEYPKK